MDLRIEITDENGDSLWKGCIYQDGSDSEGAGQISAFIKANYTMDDEEILSPCQAITKLIDDLDEKQGEPATTEELWDAMRSIAAIAAT